MSKQKTSQCLKKINELKVSFLKLLANKALDEFLNTNKTIEKIQIMDKYFRFIRLFRSYTLRNILLISKQKPEASQVAEFYMWQKLNRYIKAGEKGICILQPELYSFNTLKKKSFNTKTGKSKRMAFKLVHVFDISQTLGKSIKKPVKTKKESNAKNLWSDMQKFAKHRNIKIKLPRNGLPEDIYGISMGGKIFISDTNNKFNMTKVLVHELAHEIVHMSEDVVKLDKYIREAEAEAITGIVFASYNLEHCGAMNFVLLWEQSKTEKTRKLLTESLNRIKFGSIQLLRNQKSE